MNGSTKFIGFASADIDTLTAYRADEQKFLGGHVWPPVRNHITGSRRVLGEGKSRYTSPRHGTAPALNFTKEQEGTTTRRAKAVQYGTPREWDRIDLLGDASLTRRSGSLKVRSGIVRSNSDWPSLKAVTSPRCWRLFLMTPEENDLIDELALQIQKEHDSKKIEALAEKLMRLLGKAKLERNSGRHAPARTNR